MSFIVRVQIFKRLMQMTAKNKYFIFDWLFIPGHCYWFVLSMAINSVSAWMFPICIQEIFIFWKLCRATQKSRLQSVFSCCTCLTYTVKYSLLHKDRCCCRISFCFHTTFIHLLICTLTQICPFFYNFKIFVSFGFLWK